LPRRTWRPPPTKPLRPKPASRPPRAAAHPRRSPSSSADGRTAWNAVKSNGTSGAWAALKTRDDAGSIQLGGRQPIPIKYAYSRPSETGRLITLVAVEPLYFIGAGAPDAKSKIGHDLAVVLLDLDASGLGHGELAPAATVRVDAHQAIVTEDYGAEVVRLSKVARR